MPLSSNSSYPPSAHGHIDEILGAPPPRLVRYGSALLLCVIAMVVIIAGYIDYSDELTLTATLQSSPLAQVSSPATPAVVQQMMARDGDTVRSGAPLALLLTPQGADTIKATQSGRLSLLRVAAAGEHLGPGTPLFYIDGADSGCRIRIDVPEQLAARLALRQSVSLCLSRYPESEFGALRAIIVSLPYSRPDAAALAADAMLTHGLTSTSGSRLRPGPKAAGQVSVVVGRKSLLRSLLHF